MIRKNVKLLKYILKNILQNHTDIISVHSYAPGAIILDQNKRVSYVYIMNSGIAKCYLTEDNGINFIQEFFSEGALIGELEAINEELSFCCIEAISTVSVYKIKTSDFIKLLETDQKFNKVILRALVTKIRDKAIRHSYNQSHKLEENLIRLKRENPDVLAMLSKQDIANYLGINLRSLNRILNTN